MSVHKMKGVWQVLGRALTFGGLPLLVVTGCSEGTGDEGDMSGGPVIEIAGIVDGETVSQIVSIEATVTGTSSLATFSIIEPSELVGEDGDSALDRITAQWDTTEGSNGQVTLTVEANVAGVVMTKSVTVTRDNYSAALVADFEDGDYIRYGSALRLYVSVSPFGPSASLDRVEARVVDGTDRSGSVPIQGVYDQVTGAYAIELGQPLVGAEAVFVRINAVNTDGLISEPLTLTLTQLRDDIISRDHIPYDVEITPDGSTAVLLTKIAGSTNESMRLETVSLADPSNPLPGSGTPVDLAVGSVAPEISGIPLGNILLSPSGAIAYVAFPSINFYSVDLTSRAARLLELDSSLGEDSGSAYTSANRIPFAVMTPDGRYIAAPSSANASLQLIDVLDWYQETGSTGSTNPLSFPITLTPSKWTLMAVHPDSTYIYVVNNDGSIATAGVYAQLAVFDLVTKRFVGSESLTPSANGVVTIESASSDYKVAQQPVVTPDRAFLAVPVCNTALTGTVVRLMDLRSNPSIPTQGTNFELGSIGCGTIASVSSDSRYLLVVSQDANRLIALLDILNGQILSLEYDTGAIDGVFVDVESDSVSDLAYTQNINFTNRSMGALDLAQSTLVVDDLAVPSAAGLAPPNSISEIGYNHLRARGFMVYLVYTAYTADPSTGVLELEGAAMSIYDASLGRFIFPTP